VILPIQQQEFGIPITLEAQPDLADIPGFYRQGKGNFWVAEADDGTVVGTIGLMDIGQRDAALRKMFVTERYRGRQHGVAQRLLDTLMLWCSAQAIARVYLGTTDKFLAAHRFYEKNAFTEIGRDRLPPAFSVMSVDSKFYCRIVERGG
jgi:N-acetylglutamate synthase-like GNAT family acetyltransferase